MIPPHGSVQKTPEPAQLAPFNVKELVSLRCPSVCRYIKPPFNQSGSDRRIQSRVLCTLAWTTVSVLLQRSQKICSSLARVSPAQLCLNVCTTNPVFIPKLAYDTMCGYIFSTVFPTGMGTLNRGSIRATPKPYRNMDGDREISIRIFSVCSSLTLRQAVIEEVLKTFQTARKGSQDLTAGNYFLSRFGDPTNTEEAQSFRGAVQHKGRISYVTGWIYSFHAKHRGGPQ